MLDTCNKIHHVCDKIFLMQQLNFKTILRRPIAGVVITLMGAFAFPCFAYFWYANEDCKGLLSGALVVSSIFGAILFFHVRELFFIWWSDSHIFRKSVDTCKLIVRVVVYSLMCILLITFSSDSC